MEFNLNITDIRAEESFAVSVCVWLPPAFQMLTASLAYTKQTPGAPTLTMLPCPVVKTKTSPNIAKCPLQWGLWTSLPLWVVY